jgi:hypothetical protein
MELGRWIKSSRKADFGIIVLTLKVPAWDFLFLTDMFYTPHLVRDELGIYRSLSVLLPADRSKLLCCTVPTLILKDG